MPLGDPQGTSPKPAAKETPNLITYATFLSPHGVGTEGRTARPPRTKPAPVRARPYILRVPASVAVAVDVAVTILPKKILTNAMLVPVYAVVGMLMAKSAHSFGAVWSMPSSKILSAFISVLVKLTLTDFVEAGVTTGAVMLANAAPSLLIWKSPVAIVGLFWNSPGLAMLSSEI